MNFEPPNPEYLLFKCSTYCLLTRKPMPRQEQICPLSGGQYIDRAIKAQPDSAEANFLYGMMLSEGGGFKEGQKYLDRAVGLGYTEAEQSLAQSDLLSDRRSEALSRLRRLEQKVPDNKVIRQQIKLIEDGKYYIWDLPAPDINVSPNSINQTS